MSDEYIVGIGDSIQLELVVEPVIEIAISESPKFKRVVEIKILNDGTELTIGNDQFKFAIPIEYGGYILSSAQAFVTTVSSSGNITIQVRNVTTGEDMLSTPIRIDATEFTSYTSSLASVTDDDHYVVSTGDIIAIDVDGAGTGAKGLGLILTFEI